MEELLKIEHLKKSYDGENVLDDINLTVKKGEVIVIVGPSGCGKSTFLRCINALEEIQDGSITIDGAELNPKKNTKQENAKNLKELRQKVGMVFQNYELFPHLNVMDNILLAPRKVQRRSRDEIATEARELLQRVGLSDKEKSFPRQLSGGQKQRVAIVRALCMHPEILLFDEVTAALDPEMVREVLDCVLDLAKEGKTMLIVTHEMQFARAIADRVIFIDEGRIVEEAAPEAFFEQPKSERAKKFLNVFKFDHSDEETKTVS